MPRPAAAPQIGGRLELSEWRDRLQLLSDRAEALRLAEGPAVEQRAQLALEAVSLLWPGWGPELVSASARASLLADAPVVVGRPLALALLESEAVCTDVQDGPALPALRLPVMTPAPPPAAPPTAPCSATSPPAPVPSSVPPCWMPSRLRPCSPLPARGMPP